MSGAEVDRALTGLDGWERTDAGLRRTIEAATFPAAIALVQRVAQVAEHLDHHPDIDIRWRRVTFTCVTHSAEGITELDVDLAREISELARQH